MLYIFSAALRATFNSFTTHHCKRALNFTLNEQYPLKSKEECTLAPADVEVGSSFLVLSNDASCENNCHTRLEPGKEYEVGGHYYRDAAEGCDSIIYQNISPSNALVAEYDPRKNVGKFVEKANVYRCGTD